MEKEFVYFADYFYDDGNVSYWKRSYIVNDKPMEKSDIIEFVKQSEAHNNEDSSIDRFGTVSEYCYSPAKTYPIFKERPF